MLTAFCFAGTAQAEAWLTSWDEAAKVSARTGKPILMDFTGSNWCGWCQKLKLEVFDTPEFAKWASKKVVLLELDFPQGIPQDAKLKQQNARLAEKYDVKGYPTIMFVTAKGDVLGQSGYGEGGPKAWTSKADELLKKK